MAVDFSHRAPRVIGLTGLAGSGKSASAAVLADLGYVRLRFAAPLKTMFRALLLSAGVEDLEAIQAMVEGDQKETPQRVLGGHTPRYVMQTLGTEWGRDCLGADFWVATVMPQVEAILAQGGRVVLEDVRFANEAAAVRGLGDMAAIWQVIRRGLDAPASAHISEGGVGVMPDSIIPNAHGLDDLERFLRRWVGAASK